MNTVTFPRFSPRLLAAGVLGAALVFASGCASNRGRPTAMPLQPMPVEPELAAALDAALLNPEPQPYVLGPGDQLEIELLDDPDSRTTTTVGPDGKIYFYLMPGLDVWGMTVDQLRDRLEQGTEEFFRERRPVSVSLRGMQSQRVWLLGRVNRPGVYPLAGNMTLLEALALAEGPASASPTAALTQTFGVDIGDAMDESADLRRAFVMRDGQRLPVNLDRLLNEGDLSQNIRLRGGDFIFIPSAGGSEVNVLGAVQAGRTIPYSRNLTLVQAIAGAGGTIEDAWVRQVAVVRGSLHDPRMAVVDYKAIITGQAPDVQLEPQDIVYVPYTPHRVLKRYVNLVLDTFVRATGVNEGARAINPNAAPVGVAVPVGP